MRRIVCVLFSVAFGFSGVAGVVPASPFCDGLVLQRGMKVPVWGRAEPGEKVTVAFADQSVSATADAQGRWRVDLAPMSASKTPRVMRITGQSAAAGAKPSTVEIADVLVGEVWLASGQSNMALLIWNEADPRVRDRNGAAIAQIVRHDDVRYANLLDWKTSETPQDAIASFKWQRHAHDNVVQGWNGGQSAVAFYFAELLRQALDVPVGIIVAAAGGTRLPPFAPKADWEASGLDERLWKGAAPGVVWNHYFAPVAPFAARGLIWYQGESDSGYCKEDEYVKMLGVFHRAWAKAFERGDFPLYLAQVAGWYDIPRAQAAYAHETENAHCAIGSDVMNAWDIHPNEKFTVALRLAMLALRNSYGWKGVKADSPYLKSVRAEAGGRVRLSFEHAESFYSYAQDLGSQTPFVLQGADGKWHPAKLENQVNVRFSPAQGKDTCSGSIRGVQLVVSSTNAPAPVAVAYTGDSRLAAVYNESALPIAPFVRKVKPWDGAASAETTQAAEPTFADRVKVLENAKVRGRIAAIGQLRTVAATEADLKNDKYVIIPLIDPATGRGYTRPALQTLLADRVTWIAGRKLEGFVLDASGISDPEEPVLYFAAEWLSVVANDLWGF